MDISRFTSGAAAKTCSYLPFPVIILLLRRRDGLVNEGDRELSPPTDLIDRAHKEGMLVHTWTFRNERRRLPSDYAGNPVAEFL